MRGGFERVNQQSPWPGAGGKMPTDNGEDGAEGYRETAERLRQLAAQVRFNFGRQQQLLSLADAFDRLAARKELSSD
jgi:hypothetical protein